MVCDCACVCVCNACVKSITQIIYAAVCSRCVCETKKRIECCRHRKHGDNVCHFLDALRLGKSHSFHKINKMTETNHDDVKKRKNQK